MLTIENIIPTKNERQSNPKAVKEAIDKFRKNTKLETLTECERLKLECATAIACTDMTNVDPSKKYGSTKVAMSGFTIKSLYFAIEAVRKAGYYVEDPDFKREKHESTNISPSGPYFYIYYAKGDNSQQAA